MRRQIKSEGRTNTGLALQLDFAAEQIAEFATDGEAEACAAVFSAGRRIGLLERLENDLLLLRRNADAGIADLKSHDSGGRGEHRMVWRPARCCGRHLQADAAVL